MLNYCKGNVVLICIRIRNSSPFEWLCTRTRFETEACSNSERGNYKVLNIESAFHNELSLEI